MTAHSAPQPPISDAGPARDSTAAAGPDVY